MNAIQQFKGEYGYYPFSKGKEDYIIPLSDPTVARLFIETLSGRDTETGSQKRLGNRKRIAFHDFSENELYLGMMTYTVFSQVADSLIIEILLWWTEMVMGFFRLSQPLPFRLLLSKNLENRLLLGLSQMTSMNVPAYALWEN